MTVDNHDELTRFIRPKQKRYVTANGELRTAAFSLGTDGNISVFITTDMPLVDTWEHVDARFPHEIIGRAHLLARTVFNERLNIDYNNTPPKHANITNFPDDKDLSLAKRQTLAINSSFDER